MNDYAGQRELIAENMMMSICIDLTKYLQELKQERKTVSWPSERLLKTLIGLLGGKRVADTWTGNRANCEVVKPVRPDVLPRHRD